jgi:hypothetical protein
MKLSFWRSNMNDVNFVFITDYTDRPRKIDNGYDQTNIYKVPSAPLHQNGKNSLSGNNRYPSKTLTMPSEGQLYLVRY